MATSKQKKYLITKQGIKIEHFDGIDLGDFHFNYPGDTKKFLAKNNEIFGKLLDTKKNLAMEQETVDHLTNIIKIARTKLEKEDADKLIDAVNNLRVSFAKKYDVLFDHITSMEKILDDTTEELKGV